MLYKTISSKQIVKETDSENKTSHTQKIYFDSAAASLVLLPFTQQGKYEVYTNA